MVLFDPLNVVKGGKFMQELNKIELLSIRGGLTGTMVNAMARLVDSLLEAGRSLGSGLRRIITGTLCPL